MSTTRFPYGVTNVTRESTLGTMGQLDPTQFHTFFDDFDRYTAAHWIVTVVGTGTQAELAGDGGLLLLTNSAADNDSIFIQNDIASFLLESGKQTFFKTRFKVNDATQSDVQVGLIVTDTTPLDATDGIFFQKDDGDANIDIYVQKNTTTGRASATAVGTLVDATFINLGFYYDGSAYTYFYIDDVLVYKLDSSSTYLPDTILNVSFGIQNGAAAAKTMTVDYIFAAKER